MCYNWYGLSTARRRPCALSSHLLSVRSICGSAQCELADEAAPGWYRVRTDYGCTGYAPAADLIAGDGNAARWEALERRTVLRGVCSVRSEPRVKGWEISRLVRGTTVAVHVAVYMGGGRYIHSTAKNGSDGVVINSLDPAHEDFRPDLPEKITAIGSIF